MYSLHIQDLVSSNLKLFFANLSFSKPILADHTFFPLISAYSIYSQLFSAYSELSMHVLAYQSLYEPITPFSR